jgi:prepilin-type processing-associated H-X9-DG protein
VTLLPSLEHAEVYNALNFAHRIESRANSTVNKMSLDCYLCPADRTPQLSVKMDVAFTSYAGNGGSGSWEVLLDGMFRSADVGILRSADITDGTSHTACFSEWIHGQLSPSGTIVIAPGMPHDGLVYTVEFIPASREAFANHCSRIPPSTVAHTFLGLRWLVGGFRFSKYNHQLPPGSNSCMIVGSEPPAGGSCSALTAQSRHNGGVNLLMADGSGRFASESISMDIWRALGSRNGAEVVESF